LVPCMCEKKPGKNITVGRSPESLLKAMDKPSAEVRKCGISCSYQVWFHDGVSTSHGKKLIKKYEGKEKNEIHSCRPLCS
jgi:hypothetical protein